MVDRDLVRDKKSLTWVLAEHAGSALLITHAAYCKRGAVPVVRVRGKRCPHRTHRGLVWDQHSCMEIEERKVIPARDEKRKTFSTECLQ